MKRLEAKLGIGPALADSTQGAADAAGNSASHDLSGTIATASSKRVADAAKNKILKDEKRQLQEDYIQ